MSSGTTAAIIIVVIIVIAAIVAFAMASRRRRLQQRFGPEYDRAVSEQDSRLRAEAELAGRQRRVRRLDVQPLSESARSRYLARWQVIQEQFVDTPQAAVAEAYALVTTVMKERGYPTTDDDQLMADLSVEHARTVSHFRSAQEITRNAAAGGVATEDLRQALIHYRELFSDLLTGPDQAGSDELAAEQNGSGAGYQSTSSDHSAPAAAAPATTDPDGMPVARIIRPEPDLEPDISSRQQGR